MTEILTPTTELEAVNAILASIGEAPVNSLSSPAPDAQLALSLLRQESRGVQTTGYEFNTEYEWELSPDINGQINLPANTLKLISASDRTIVQRGLRLYDNTNHTYEFTDPVTVTLVIGLPFDELPEFLRRFLLYRAGRLFQDRLGGDRVIHTFHANDELGAWASFLNSEAEVAGYNMLDGNALLLRLKGNR
jgi:hypothetical protein